MEQTAFDPATADLDDERIVQRACGVGGCGISKDSAVRQVIFSLSQNWVLHHFILACIFYNIVVMAMATEERMQDKWFAKFYQASDVVVTCIFTVEVAIGMLAHGVFTGKHSFVRSSHWNQLDIVVVVSSWCVVFSAQRSPFCHDGQARVRPRCGAGCASWPTLRLTLASPAHGRV
jgi:hypothetical protein